jgi:single-stranded DNA-specific DHH superfamily exonuclease
LAAGFSVSPKNLYILRRKIISRSEGVMMARGAGKRIKTEVKVSVGLLASQETLELLEQLEPSGAGNPELVLQVEGKVAGARTIGSEGQHLKIELSDEAKTVALLMWNFKKLGVKIPTVGEKLKVWGQAKRNSYRGQISTRLIGLAIRKVD